ncbi:MAG: tetratricopeptide repeat protein [Crocinitomicaceae bacterium]|nr:tetratricopeptide repeat protein [Crocinitomicaceae bacterium]
MKLLISTILLLFSIIPIGMTQSTNVDSLNVLLERETTDEEKIQLFLELAKYSQEKSQAYGYLENAENLLEGKSAREKAKYFVKIAIAYYDQKNYPKAIEKLKIGIDLFKPMHDYSKLADAYMRLGGAYRKSMKMDEALKAYLEAESYFQLVNDREGIIESLNKRGIILKNLDNYSEALVIYYKAYEIARVNGLHLKLASTCVNIGVVLKNQENYSEALDYYHKAEDIYIIQEDFFGLANIYNNIGNVYRYQKKPEAALENYNLALENREKSGKLKRLAYTYNNIGLVYFEQKKYDLAIEFYTKSEQHKLEYEDFEMLVPTYLNFAELYLEIGDDEKYKYYANLTESTARKYNQADLLREINVNNGKYEAAKGNYKKAYEHLSTAFEELDTLDTKSQKILTAVLEAHFQKQLNETELIELHELNDSLSVEAEELQQSQRMFYRLVWALSILMIVLLVFIILLYINQKAFASKSKELEDTNEQLRETMIGKEEKETLLKEIHHRVKNNMQIIKSLIRLQNTGQDDRMNKILLEFEQRVSSMALVHESLYKSGDLAKVNVASYYEDLVNDLIEAYNLKQEVSTDLSIDIEDLGIDTLVPLGLLTNEIISNSLKHGLAAKSNGIIKVDLKKIEDDYYQLYIGDNGKGFDFEEQMTNSESLGGELIEALIEQLDGDYEYIRENGSYYRINFKPQDKKATR